jgi:outer membrane protein TolC
MREASSDAGASASTSTAGLASRAAPCIGLLLLVLLTGCKPVGPNYNRPGYEAPAGLQGGRSFDSDCRRPNPAGGSWQPASPSDGMLRGKWWEIYQDPQLNQLEERIATDNQSLRQALETYLAARDQVSAARAALFPTLSAGPSASATMLSANGPSYSAGKSTDYYNDLRNSPARPVGSRTSGAAFAAPSRPPARTPRPAPRTWPAWT